MHKAAAITISTLLMTSLIMLVPFGSTNIYPNPAMAQGYDNYDDNRYNKYPIDDKKYECRIGPFEGFFVSSVEFCKHVKFNDKDNKDNGNGDNYGYHDGSKKPFYIFPPSERIAELGDTWWQWIYSLDNTTDTNPFINFGQAGCDVGLQDNGKFLYLVGVGLVTPDVPTNPSLPIHNCIISSDDKILLPIVNTACNSLSLPPFNGTTEEEQRQCSNNFIDTVEDLQLKIDGKSIHNLEQYRLESPPGGFDLEIVENNILGDPAGNGIAVSDGYWILLKLNSGKHQVSFRATANLTDFGIPLIFTTGGTYNLDVQPAEKPYYQDDYQQNYPNDYQQNYPNDYQQNYPNDYQENYPKY